MTQTIADTNKTREELIAELQELRRQLDGEAAAGALQSSDARPPVLDAEDVKALNRVNDALIYPLDLSRILDTIVEELQHVLDVTSCSIWLKEPATGNLICQHAIGPGGTALLGWRLSSDEGITGQVARDGKSVIVDDTRADERHFKGIDRQTGMESRAILAAPLRVGSEIIGVLEIVDSKPNRFDASLLALVEPLAGVGACAISSSQLYTENRRLSQFLKTIITSANIWITVADARGNILLWNQFAELASGYSHDVVVGHRRVWKWLIPERDYRRQLFRAILTEFQRGAMLEGMEIPIHTRDGDTRVISWHSVPLVNEEEELVGAVAFGRDVTNLTRLQSEVLKAKKLEAVGALAGGIAHNFNNLLTGVLGNIALVKESISHDPKAQTLLQEAEEASLRARDLTGQLLTFAQGGAPVRKPEDMAGLLRGSVRKLWGRSGVSIESIIPNDLWPAEADERQLNQAIHNLVRRARQVTPAGEVVHLVARNTTLDADEGLPLPSGRYVEIMVGDRGPEIPDQALENIFDPFYPATHDAASLGLAVAYSIVRAHDGHVYVDSEAGRGTTFHVLVPAIESIEAATAEGIPAPDAAMRSLKILLMDDQRMVQRVAGLMLQHLNHTVDFADEGAEAIDKYQEAMAGGEPYDVVIMDLTVPEGMGGLTAMGELLKIDPGVRAIVSSGYSSDPVMANYETCGFRSVLVKPYLMEDLRAAISEVLAR